LRVIGKWYPGIKNIALPLKSLKIGGKSIIDYNFDQSPVIIEFGDKNLDILLLQDKFRNSTLRMNHCLPITIY
jgi:hypothetical protein